MVSYNMEGWVGPDLLGVEVEWHSPTDEGYGPQYDVDDPRVTKIVLRFASFSDVLGKEIA